MAELVLKPTPRRGWPARRVLSTALIVVGTLLLADVLTTLVWQEPVTALVGAIQRAGVNKRYLSYASTPLTRGQQSALTKIANTDAKISYLARTEQAQVPNGAAVGRLVIRKLGVSFYVVQGTSTGDLERGPGHYAGTALPGLGGTVAIAGHRTTYLAPFRNLNELVPGDQIQMQMPYGTFTYVVQHSQIVKPDAWWITRNVGYEQLVLSACNPVYSASQRIAVFARLKSVNPTRSAVAPV